MGEGAFGIEEQAPLEGEQLRLAVEQLNLLVDDLAGKRAVHVAAKARLSQLAEQVDAAEQKVKRMLEAAGLERFDGNSIVVRLRERTTVKIPKDLGEKQALFSYLRERGIFEEMISVHSATLNSWYRSECEELEASGKVPEVPGLKPSSYVDLVVNEK